ncbi:MAG TPA: hypothetical protein VMY39_06065 [Planctomycetota bacterium]|nr:hypothetical protein [Planctomycetota bacterium]
MSEPPKAPQPPAQPGAPDVEVESTDETPAAPVAGPGDGNFTLRALIVAAVTFVVVLGMVIGVYVFNVMGKPGSGTPEDDRTVDKQEPETPTLASVTLLEKNVARTVIGPQRDQSVTCIYTLAVRVPTNRVERVQKLVDPAGDNLLAVVKEKVRRIIMRTEYPKLCEENLDGAKLQIIQELNLLLGDDIVKQVVFEEWTVTQ